MEHILKYHPECCNKKKKEKNVMKLTSRGTNHVNCFRFLFSCNLCVSVRAIMHNL